MDDPLVGQIVNRIVSASRPVKVVLLGSRGRGQHSPESDYDLLVIRKSDEPRYQRAVPLYEALVGLLANVDIMVYTPEEVSDWSNVPEAFVTTALREGKVLYEAEG
jgi:predicted nucleotidyltransferase